MFTYRFELFLLLLSLSAFQMDRHLQRIRLCLLALLLFLRSWVVSKTTTTTGRALQVLLAVAKRRHSAFCVL
jgi:hypothetical protein